MVVNCSGAADILDSVTALSETIAVDLQLLPGKMTCRDGHQWMCAKVFQKVTFSHVHRRRRAVSFTLCLTQQEE